MTIEDVQKEYSGKLTANGHHLTGNVIENNDTVALYCGWCGHGFAVKLDSKANKATSFGQDFEAKCNGQTVSDVSKDTDKKIKKSVDNQ